MQNPFVTTDWLAEHRDDPDVVIVDGSWHMPNADRKAREEYLAGHIPGAVFFDIDEIADRDTDLPHMLPAPATFARMVGDLGISDSQTIVVYDEAGLFSAPRVWWTFKAMGAADIRILEGGGPKWRLENRPLQSGETRPAPAVFETHYDPARMTDFDTVRNRSQDGAAQIVDARPAPRFTAEVPEPRPGLRGGHIPGSLNVPVNLLSEGGKMKSPEALRELFKEKNIAFDRPVITSCGSGITASTLALALQLAGADDVAVYDGSWAEWGSRPDSPIAR